MRNIGQFLLRQNFFFIFLLLEVISFILLVQNNIYQRSSFINSTNTFTGSILATINNVSQYFSLKDANHKLAEENVRLLNESKKYYMMTDEQVFLYKDTLYRQQYEFISAKVIGNTTNKRNNYLTLNKGSRQGIQKDMGVITSNGIVGIVKEVSPNFSSVISVLHKDTKISAKVKKNGHLGTVNWSGGDYRYGELIDIPTHVKPILGDTVITSGYSSSFPEGIMIGIISDFRIEKGDNFYTITIKFSTDFNNISYAYVIRNIMKDELNRLTKDSQND
ncbi:MAG: rod shape-determining protein MreC [Bacteroidales bacterium]|jgi:rod shape-determining protein MreC